MAFVSASSHAFSGASVSFSQAVAAGDVLLVVLSAQRWWVESGEATPERLSIPDGWERLGQFWDAEATGRPTSKSKAVLVVWKRIAAAGTEHATFTWDGPAPRMGNARVTRWSGMKAVRGVASARAEYRVVYPPVSPERGSPSPTGHALRLAVTGRRPMSLGVVPLVPSGHTLRTSHIIDTGYIGAQDRYETWNMVLSEQALTAVAPGPSSQVNTGTGRSTWAVTIYLASTHGPDAPVISGVADGVTDLSQAWTLAWTPAGAQTGVRVTRTPIDGSGAPTGAIEYLTSLSSPAWSNTETTITTTTTQVEFPASHWPAAGARYRIEVATVGDANAPDLGDAASVDVESWQAPTATSAMVSGDISSGTITLRAPWIYVQGTAGSGAALDRAEVEAIEEGTGRILAAGTHGPGWWYPIPATPEEALPNGVSFRVRGRVRQRGVQWSEWITSGLITVNAPRPATPTVAVTPITHPVSGLPGLAVSVASVAGAVAIYRDGEKLDTWDSTGSITVADYIPPTPVSYTATVTTGSPLPEESLSSAPVTSTMSLPDSWLVDPLNPADAVRVPRIDFTETIGHPSTVYYPLTSGEIVQPIVQSLTPHTPSGTITFSIETHAQEAAVIRMLTSGRPLVYTRWPEYTYDPLCEVSVLRPLRFIPVGEIAITHMKGLLQWRDISVGWVEQR